MCVQPKDCLLQDVTPAGAISLDWQQFQLTCPYMLLPATAMLWPCSMQVLADFARERAGVVTRAQAQVTAAGGEVDALRRLLRLKGRELQHLRRLAQQVLLQRTEVEIFLLSSLHQVGAMYTIDSDTDICRPAAGARQSPDGQQATCELAVSWCAANHACHAHRVSLRLHANNKHGLTCTAISARCAAAAMLP
jgi:hypothetical protein